MSEPIWRRYLRFVRPDVRGDVDDEVRFHLDSRAREFETAGLDAARASRAARERFGDVERVRSWLYHHDRRRHGVVGRMERWRMLRHHLRYAIRGLRKQPGFTLASVLTLALGIGATSAIFAVVDGVLIAPLPYPESERLVAVWHGAGSGGQGELPISQALFTTYRQFGHSFSSLGAHVESAVNLTDGSVPERVPADSATAGLFSALGITPIAGRGFTEADERPGGPNVVLISERLWEVRFGRAASAIGRQIRIDDVPHQIIGVLPSGTSFPSAANALWLPLRFDPAVRIPIGFQYSAVGRLRAGVTRSDAARDLQGVLPRVQELFPNAAPGLPTSFWLSRIDLRVALHPLRDDIVGDIGRVLWVITATIGFVLLAACANIANLFLARSESRHRELAVHAALGADRRDVSFRFMAEALVLAAAGAVIGTAVAALGLGWIKRTEALAIPRLAEVQLAGRALLVTMLVTLGVALFTALLPILKAGDRDLASVLRTGGRGAGTGREGRRVQRSLVVTQVALAYVLLTACALLGRTFVELRRVRLGFEPDRVLAFRMALPAASYPDLGSTLGFLHRLEAALGALPGIGSVGFTTDLPLEPGRRNTSTVLAEGDIEPEGEATAPRTTLSVSGGYLAALGIPMLSGRTLSPTAVDTAGTEAVVNAAFARTVWGDPTGIQALGKRLRFLPTAPALTVVGVVGDLRDATIDRPPAPTIYLQLNTSAWRGGNLFVPRALGVVLRTAGDPAAMSGSVRREVSALDPGLPLYRLGPLSDAVRASMARTSITALLLAIAALVALALGTVGLFGIVSYSVGQKRREIGLRVAWERRR